MLAAGLVALALSLDIDVVPGRSGISAAFCEELELELVSALRDAEGFTDVRAVVAPTPRPDALRLEVRLPNVEDRTEFDVSLAQTHDPTAPDDVQRAYTTVLHYAATVVLLDPAGRTVRQDRVEH